MMNPEAQSAADRRPAPLRAPGHRLVSALCLLVAALASRPSRADRVARLIQLLRTDPSYKVRLQVAITLGKLKNKRAVPALVRTLRDKKATVRGVAAAALGQIGAPRAITALKKLLKRERNSFARKQATKALAALQRSSTAPKNARFFVTVGKVRNKSGKGGKRLSRALEQALLREFGKVRDVTTTWGGRKPKLRELRKRRVKAFVLDGSVVSVSQQNKGSEVVLSCSIRVSLATYPQNSMKAFYTGGASLAVPASSYNASQAIQLYKDIVEGAAQGAREHIVRSYLSNQ